MSELKTFVYKTHTLLPWINCGKPDGVFHGNYAPNDIRDFAQRLMVQWGLVAATEDGEDTAGRAKLRCKTPEEIVDFACNIAEKAFAEFDKRGWLERAPTLAELARSADLNYGS